MKHAIGPDTLQSLDREGAEGFDFQETIRLLTRAALNKATKDRVRIPRRHHPMYGLPEFETAGH
jgi:hypothetical protein